MTIVVKKVPKWLRGFVKLIFGVKESKWLLPDFIDINCFCT